MSMKHISADRLDELDRQLLGPPRRSSERRLIIHEMAAFYGVSDTSLYRALRSHLRPKAVRRADRGLPRVLPREEMERYCELIAAVKLRTSNKKGRCLSTGETIRLLEGFGVETPEGLVKIDPGVLKRSTVNRYLRQWGFDKQSWTRQPAAVRFQAEHSNECWQFDLSPSDLKQIEEPPWLRADRAAPTLMLFSVVDDRSGVAYQEYRCVYGEDVEAALRFLFNAMSEKAELPFQGIPQMIYTDNGPIAKLIGVRWALMRASRRKAFLTWLILHWPEKPLFYGGDCLTTSSMSSTAISVSGRICRMADQFRSITTCSGLHLKRIRTAFNAISGQD
jgi:hypothetical protein